MKRFLLTILATIFVACGTAACVILPKKFEYDKQLQEQSTNTDLAESSLMGLVENLLDTKTYEGDITFFAYDQSIKLDGKLRILNEDKFSLSLDINGHINQTPLTASFIFADNTLFCEYENLKLYCSTNDAMSIITEVMSYADTSVDSVIDMTMVQDMLGNIATEEYANGSVTKITLPILNEVVLTTDANDFPTSIKATNIEVSDKTFCLDVNIKNTLTKNITKPQTEGYINFAPSKQIIGGIFATYKQLPIRFAGTISVNGIKANANIKIDKNLNIEATVNYSGLNAKAYLVDGNAYLNFSNIYAKVSVPELFELLNFSGTSTPSSITITDLTQNHIEVQNVGSIIFDYNNDGSIRRIDLNLGDITAEFGITMTSGEVVAPNPSYILNASNLKSIATKYQKLVSSDYSIMIDATINNINVTGSTYLHTEDLKSISKFIFDGKINNTAVMVAYKDNNYYLETGSIKAKFSHGSVSDMLNLLSETTGLENVSTQEVIDTITSSFNKINLSKSGNLEIDLKSGAQISLLPYTSETKVNVTNLSVGTANISANLSVFHNNSSFEKLLDNKDFSSFVDCSNSPALAKALLNTLNSTTYSLSGSLAIKWNKWEIINVSTKVTFEKVNNNQRIIVNLSSLPTSAIFTQHNAITNKSQSVTIVLEGDNISVTRYLHKRFSSSKVIAYSQTMKLSDVEVSDFVNFLGLKQNLVSDITNSGKPASVNPSTILDLVDMSESKVIANLNTSAIIQDLSDCCMSVSYGSKITGISAVLKYTDSVTISLNLSD